MINQYLAEKKKEIEGFLGEQLISPNEEYNKLYEAMNYSLLMGGKRIRPILIMAVMESFGKNTTPVLDIICAIELVHSYSLIHDDLPAMDNDDYRRGALTNHKVFGDGMAVLAGDGLLTYAFQLISNNTYITAQQKVACIKSLATAAGPEGMVGGQAFDLLSEGHKLPLEKLKILHGGKTGAMFKAAIEMGLILSDVDESTFQSYMIYAEKIGLLFQITDDILDVTGSIEELGKMPGSDDKQDKATYVSILGLEEAKVEAQKIAKEAKMAIQETDANAIVLNELVDYLIDRSN